MQNLKAIKAVARKNRGLLRGKYKVTKLGVFGPYARGGITKASDIDILVDFSSPPTSLNLFA